MNVIEKKFKPKAEERAMRYTWQSRQEKLHKNYNHKRGLKGLNPISFAEWQKNFTPRKVTPKDCFGYLVK